MNKDDMIFLISVDDHIVEPPDMFKNHLAKKYLDEAPRLVHNPPDGSDTWQFRDVVIPNVALNAVAGRPPKEEYGWSLRVSTRSGRGGAGRSTTGSRT